MAGKDLLASENTKGKDLLADSSQGTDLLSQSDQPYDINKITGSGLGGVVAGFATPEITMGLGKALQMVPYGPVRAVGKGMEYAAPFMTTAERVGGAVAGGVSAAGGETAKEFLEKQGVRPSIAQAVGTSAEIISPSILSATKNVIKALGSTVTGGKVGIIWDAVARAAGKSTEQLTEAERNFIASESEKMRAGSPAARPLYQEIEKGATQIGVQADAAAWARQQKAEQEALNKLTQAGTMPTLADRVVTKAQSNVHSIGNADADMTDIGKVHRQSVLKQFSEEELSRNAEYQAKKAERDAIVSSKEAENDLLNTLPEYEQAVKELNDLLLVGKISPEVKTATETEGSVLSSYQKIKDALSPVLKEVDIATVDSLRAAGVPIRMGVNPKTGEPAAYRVFQPSFNAIDTLRRKLGDVAFGEEKVGFEGLGQNIAKKWYGKLSDIQSKYVGEVQDELQAGWELSSGLLERFKGGPGFKVLKTEKLSPEMFSQDANKIPSMFFSNKEGPARLVALTKDPTMVEKTASDYVASNLRGKSADQARSWIDRNEFLRAPEMKNVKAKAESYAQQLEGAETRSSGIKSTGQAKEKLALEEQARGIAESKKISEEGKARIQLILGDRFPEQRISDLLNSKSKVLWQEVASVLQGSPQGKELIGRALSQHLADIAERGGKSFAAVDALREVREPLISTGLATDVQLDSLEKQLNAIRQPENQKMSWLGRQLIQAISVPVGASFGSVIGGMAPAMFGGK